MELEEERRSQKEREQSIIEQQKKIHNLNNLTSVSDSNGHATQVKYVNLAAVDFLKLSRLFELSWAQLFLEFHVTLHLGRNEMLGFCVLIPISFSSLKG